MIWKRPFDTIEERPFEPSPTERIITTERACHGCLSCGLLRYDYGDSQCRADLSDDLNRAEPDLLFHDANESRVTPARPPDVAA